MSDNWIDEHRDYMEGLAQDRLDLERREPKHLWKIVNDEPGYITIRHSMCDHRFRHDAAVTFANAILSEVEFAQRGDDG